MGRRYHTVMLFGGIAALMLCILAETHTDTAFLFGRQLPASCIVNTVTGASCPGCGLTRSAIAAGHLRFQESLRLHPAGWIVLLILLLHLPYRILSLSHASVASSVLFLCVARTARLLLLVVIIAGFLRLLY